MRAIFHEINQILRHNKDGSFSTQDSRKRNLRLSIRELHQLGYMVTSVHNLKPKHTTALIDHWNSRFLAIGTIKNRLTHHRWLLEKIDKSSIMPRTNAGLGIPNRKYVTNINKAFTLDNGKVNNIENQYVQASLALQEAFGLRRETAIKIRPKEADQGNYLVLQSSWTKGGKQYQVEIRNKKQRKALEFAKQVAGKGSLIPQHLSYIQQLKQYERITAKAGLSKLHGLRHKYAQVRYFELTGFLSPKCGGLHRRYLSLDNKTKDMHARKIISRELGHERIQITAIYLGS